MKEVTIEEFVKRLRKMRKSDFEWVAVIEGERGRGMSVNCTSINMDFQRKWKCSVCKCGLDPKNKSGRCRHCLTHNFCTACGKRLGRGGPRATRLCASCNRWYFGFQPSKAQDGSGRLRPRIRRKVPSMPHPLCNPQKARTPILGHTAGV